MQKSTISCSNTTTFRHDSGCGDRSSYLIRDIFSEKNSKESFSKKKSTILCSNTIVFGPIPAAGIIQSNHVPCYFPEKNYKVAFKNFRNLLFPGSSPAAGIHLQPSAIPPNHSLRKNSNSLRKLPGLWSS